MSPADASAAEITLRFLAAPTDAGQSGSVSAGRVLEWIDKAGYAAAAGWSGTYAVTAYVGNVRFTRPVEVGELVEVTARVVHTGRSSMHITVDVASGQPRTREMAPATRCLIIFVAVDEQGRSTPVPPLRAAHPGPGARGALGGPTRRPARAGRDRDGRPGLHRCRHAHRASSCASSRPRPTSTGAARCTAASSCGGSTRPPTSSRPAGPAATGTSRSSPVGCASTDRCGSGTSSRSRRGCCTPGAPRCTSGCTCARATPPTGPPAWSSRRTAAPSSWRSTRSAGRVPCPTWVPANDEDRALDAHAVELVRIRDQFGDLTRNFPARSRNLHLRTGTVPAAKVEGCRTGRESWDDESRACVVDDSV